MPTPLATIRSYDALVMDQDRPYVATLRARDGKIIGLIRGYIADGFGLILYQLNPRDFPKAAAAGPSLLHRALLIRQFIAMGLTGVIFIGGCSGMLEPRCTPVRARTFLAMSARPSAWLRTVALLLVQPRLWLFLVRKLAPVKAAPAS